MSTPEIEERRVPPKVPGCGLAAFSMLLLVMFLIGLTGVSIAYYSLFTSGRQLSPTKLSYGGVVDTTMLAPMRAAGLIGPEELPDAFHAEFIDGSRACAISSGKVLRLDGGVGQTLALADVREVKGDAYAVEAVGPTGSLTCYFGEGEGGDRFKRMLEQR